VDVKKPLRHGPSETSPHSPATVAQGQIFFPLSALSPPAAAVNLPQPARPAQPSRASYRVGRPHQPFTGDTAGRSEYPGEGRTVSGARPPTLLARARGPTPTHPPPPL